ncbi:MAG: aldehyde dehydrogenase family protein [Acidobacteriota bacterium]
MGSYADLDAIAEARDLTARARDAQRSFAESSQERVDAVVAAMAAAAKAASVELAQLAHEETGFGNVEDKNRKNLFSAVTVHDFIRPMKTVGVLREDAARKVYEIAEPVGVVAAVLPCTNPTSTAIYKILIAVKSRNGVVLSPHPAARRAIQRTAEIMKDAAVRAGAPEGLIACIGNPTPEGVQALMRDKNIGVILATGGSDLVRAAYSAGKPCFGVGPGNVPAYVHASADPRLAVERILAGKTFDCGTLCSSEQAVIADVACSDAVVRELAAQGAYFLPAADQEKLAHELFTPRLTVQPKLLGKPATRIAELCGIQVPKGTRALVAPLAGVGPKFPLSAEKLSPVLAYYVVKDWKEGCDRCKEILAFGGSGHTLAVHGQDKDVIFQFALQKPAFRIIANAPAATGAVGLGTGLDPAMTLGCGAMGGNITSDNISPLHLINRKRLAFGIEDTVPAGVPESAVAPAASSLGKAPADLRARAERFLQGKGVLAQALPAQPPAAPAPEAPAPETPAPEKPCPRVAAAAPVPRVDFVCEDDVRTAIREKRRIVVHGRTIITPAARDLGALHDIFQGG